MEKLKALFIISLFAERGGAEKNLYEVLLNLDRNRYIPYLVCMRGGRLFDEIKSRGIDARIIDPGSLFSLKAIKRGYGLYKFIRETGIDIVVSYGHDADIWGGGAALLARRPVVISSRRDLGFQLQKKHVFAYRLLNKFYDGIITVSGAVKETVISREKAPSEKIRIVYNGLKPYEMKTEDDSVSELKIALGIPENARVVGMLGGFWQVKGHLFLIKAMARVVRKYPEARAVLAGYTNSPYFKEAQKLIRESGLEGKIICPGQVHDTGRFSMLFDIFVQPSLSEGFSNAVIEAMSAGLPVIASSIGGNREAVIHGETGLLVPPEDPHALANAICTLLEDQEVRKKMGRSGKARMREFFGFERMMSGIESTFEELYAKKNRARRNLEQRLKLRAKIAISCAAVYSGAGFLKRKLLSQSPRILAYHSINKISFPELEIERTPQEFEREIKYIARNFNVISLDEYLEYRGKGRGFPRNCLMLTFDDGYRDNYLNAYPLLNKYKLPATIFITTEPLETGDCLPFDALRIGIANTRARFLDLTDIGLRRFYLSGRNGKLQAIRELMKLARENRKTGLPLKLIYEKLELDYEEFRGLRLYLHWEEIAEMGRNGISFGSHTLTHPRLSILDEEECKKELAISKSIIEERTGKPVRALAYPFGTPEDFNLRVETSAKEAGYECAFALHLEKGGNGFTIPRICVDSHMTTGMKGTFCKPLFAAELAGIFGK